MTPYRLLYLLRLRVFSLLLLFSLLTSSSSSAQLCTNAWKQKYPTQRASAAVAYDTQRNVLVLFGGEDNSSLRDGSTWEWNGTIWEMKSDTGPSPRAGHQMVYDSARGVVVLFGGSNASARSNETWEWNGSTWTQKMPATNSPSPRSYHSMIYDEARHVTLLFGGLVAESPYYSDETWEWDGNDWTLLNPQNRPSGRYTAGMSFDIQRSTAVLFGGADISGANGETWEWNGSNWSLKNPLHKPVAADRRSMAYDSNRQVSVLLSISYNGSSWVPETWEWNGSDWTQRNPVTSLGAREWPALAYDALAQRVVVFGGYDYQVGDYVGGLWSWNNATESWQEDSTIPLRRSYHAMVYDSARNTTVLYGGGRLSAYSTTVYGDTWEENGSSWIKRQPVNSPPTLLSHVMAFDSIRNKTVIFGGWPGGASGYSSETWEWNGSNWEKATPAQSPPPRGDAAMTFDIARGEMVLFGGLDSSGYSIGDTWVYNGINWSQKFPAHSPAPRIYSSMAYDAVRQVTVLYGGTFGQTDVATWEWNGQDWLEIPRLINPGARSQALMTYNPDLGRIMLFGGGFNTTWSWNGSDWLNLQVGQTSDRYSSSMVYDIARRKALMFGGATPSTIYGSSETWTLDVADDDLDGTLNCADSCPTDPGKISPGTCGCGVADSDTDSDGTLDCFDSCPADPLKTNPLVCGCGVSEEDSDGDLTPNCTDACVSDANKIAPGSCGCGVSDLDSDGDGTANCIDACPNDVSKISQGVCGCGVPDTDLNGNGVVDCIDATISSVIPSKPKLKIVKKLVSVTMSTSTGASYVLKYRWLTGNAKKDKKIKPKTVVSTKSVTTLKGAKVGLTLELSYHYRLPGPKIYESLESKVVKLKIKSLRR